MIGLGSDKNRWRSRTAEEKEEEDAVELRVKGLREERRDGSSNKEKDA